MAKSAGAIIYLTPSFRFVPQNDQQYCSQSFGPFPSELKQHAKFNFDLSRFNERDLIPLGEDLAVLPAGEASGQRPENTGNSEPHVPLSNVIFVPLVIVIETFDPETSEVGGDAVLAPNNSQATYIRFVERDGALYPKVIKQKLQVI